MMRASALAGEHGKLMGKGIGEILTLPFERAYSAIGMAPTRAVSPW